MRCAVCHEALPTGSGRHLRGVRETCYRRVEVAAAVWSGYVIKTPPPGGGPAYQPLSGR